MLRKITNNRAIEIIKLPLLRLVFNSDLESPQYKRRNEKKKKEIPAGLEVSIRVLLLNLI